MARATWKYVPRWIGIYDRREGKFYPEVQVDKAQLEKPVGAQSHAGTGIRGDAYLLSMHTEHGTRHYGVAAGCITPRLKVAVKLLPGQERDEVVAKWKNAPANVCPIADYPIAAKNLLGTRPRRRRKRR